MIRIVPRMYIFNLLEKTSIISLPHPWVLISIHSDMDGKHSAPISRLDELSCKDYISLCFQDIAYEKGEYNRFTDKQADEVLSFVDKHKDKNFLVHCDAGISRSGAVGTFVCRYLKKDEKIFSSMNPYIRPNNLVLDKLQDKAGLKDEYYDFWNHVDLGDI